MRRTILFRVLAVSALLMAFSARAAEPSPLVKGSGQAVYYLDQGKRYVFPNEKVYFSWYPDFSGVRAIGDDELATYLIGGNVTYKPAYRLVKIQSDPRVYAVGGGGALRWITSEDAAKRLFGADWSKQVDDIPDAFFLNYKVGEPIADAADFDVAAEKNVAEIADDFALRNGQPISQDFRASKAIGTWSDGNTWGGKAPTTGSKVVIPAGTKVIYDLDSSPNLKSLEVDGTLAFWDQHAMRLSARTIVVNGTLTAGTEGAPQKPSAPVTIALTGVSASDASDGLRVNGTLDLHAAAGMTRTSLRASAMKGARTLALAEKPDWKAGDRIVVAPSGADPHGWEEAVISDVNADVVTIASPLAYDHRVDESTAPDVARLDRSIVVTGVGTGQGSGIVAGRGALVRLEGVALRGLGRAGVTGVYPMAFDGLGDGSASYVKDSVISGSGNRCLVLTATGGVTVQGNVAEDVGGRCFATEDGTETKAVFRGNLVVGVRNGGATSDEPATGFALKNPDVTVESNVVAGSEGYGYWYDVANSEAHFGVFRDDAARSTARSALYVGDADAKSGYGPEAKASFTGFTAAWSGDYGFWLRGSNMEVSGATLVQNRVGGRLSAFAAAFKDSTVVGETATASSTYPTQAGFEFDEGPISVSGIAFRGFVTTSKHAASAFTFHAAADRLMDPRSAIRDITYVRAQPWRADAPSKVGDMTAVVRDLDAGKSVTARSAFLDDPGCQTDAAAGVRTCANPYAQLVVALRGATDARPIVFDRLDNKSSVTLEPGPSFDGAYAYMTVDEGKTYRIKTTAANRFSFDYGGTTSSIVVRLAGPSTATVKGATATYDNTLSELVIPIDPGGSVDVSW